jgi:DNA replication protein DnaC
MTTTTGTPVPVFETVSAGRMPTVRKTAPDTDELEVLIDQACLDLRLPTIRAQYPELIAAATRDGLGHKQFLADLLGTERAEQAQRRRFRMVRAAGFPRPKRIEDFDYAANPNVRPEQIGALTDPDWVRKALPLCLIGDCGTGKSHLLIGIGTAMAEAGLHVRYVTTAALVNELVEAAGDKQLSRLISRYSKIDLLCLDEFGYVNLDKRGANLLFQIFTEREERHATAIASNSPFSKAHMFARRCARWHRDVTSSRRIASCWKISGVSARRSVR